MSHQGHHTLTAKDVVFVEGFERSASLFKNDATLRIKDLLAKIESICIKSGELSSDEIAILFGNGIACEVLRPGAADWQTGSLHLSLQFQAGGLEPIVASAAAPAVAAPAVAAPAIAGQVEAVAPAVVAAAVAASSTPIAMESPANAEVVSHEDLNAFADDSSDAAMGLGGLDDALDEFGLEAEVSALDLDVPAAEGEFGADLMGLMGNDAPTDDDFPGLDEFDLDSTPAPAASIDELSSPWDLSDDLDSMLMAN